MEGTAVENLADRRGARIGAEGGQRAGSEKQGNRKSSHGAIITSSALTIDTMLQPLIYLSRPQYGDAVNKRDLIRKIASDASLTNLQAARALDAFLDGVQSSLMRGDRVTLVGFGTFAAVVCCLRNV